MYKSKLHKPAYNSKEIFVLYICKVNFFFLYLKLFKTYSGLNVIAFYFEYYRIAKKNQLIKILT